MHSIGRYSDVRRSAFQTIRDAAQLAIEWFVGRLFTAAALRRHMLPYRDALQLANLDSPRVCVVACKRTVVVITVVVAVIVAVEVAVVVAVVVAVEVVTAVVVAEPRSIRGSSSSSRPFCGTLRDRSGSSRASSSFTAAALPVCH